MTQMTATDRVQRGMNLLLSSPVFFGMIVGIGLAIGGVIDHQIIPGLGVLYSEIALGAALLSVALIALSVVVGLFSGEDIRLLEQLAGVDNAIRPYVTVAIGSGIGVLVATISTFIWPISPAWLTSIMAAAVAGLTTFAVVGTISLVNNTGRLAALPSRFRIALEENGPDATGRSVNDPHGNQPPS